MPTVSFSLITLTFIIAFLALFISLLIVAKPPVHAYKDKLTTVLVLQEKLEQKNRS
jgi:hypothetical protein